MTAFPQGDPAAFGDGAPRMIRTVIVDDEPPALDELAWLLSRFPDIEVVAKAESGDEAVELIGRMRPDLVFLDIEMPDKNGFQVLRELMVRGRPPLVVFATAFDEHAIRAFEQNTVDYILKPISLERIGKTIERVRDLLARPSGREASERLESLLAKVGLVPEGGAGIVRIPVEDTGRNVLLSPKEILLFSHQDRRVVAHTAESVYPCSPELSLDRLEERLAGFNFFRANRAELINLKFVRSYAPWHSGKYVVTMRHREAMEIALSKSRVRDFKAALGI
ncbi:LytTR family DNA-binding domain-containing protein [Pseudodesulfovibrio sp.]|uniref:LytR/AlgR family response regulator transcription factor n=1 Tax=Pseudodesulfovibrio sp. TaxID=2035812 RepID=UPI00263513F3|nr:LytTR family DNA-binding domain-containing protein [Pseudodesulfovibrio sp.]MDD3311316.1 LytTR family DNA-binding domain-containing protein [Pseudodesulfovibrio sp.]